MNESGLINRLLAWLPLLPLLLLLAGTYWLNQQVLPPVPKADDSKRHDPDYIVSNFSATSFNTQGAPRFMIDAQQMRHYPDNDSTHLNEPHLTSLDASRPPILASARFGEISRNGSDIFLREEVKVVRPATATQNELVLTTSYLHVDPDHDVSDTDRPLTLTDATNIIHAVGMRLDNKARQLKLLAQVRSQHEPPPH